MAITLHWFLPTNGDSRSDLSLGNAVGAAGSRVNPYGADRAPDLDYLRLVAGAAEKLGFAGALTPTSSWCEDAWVFTAALSQLTSRFKFLVAFRPGLQAPTLVAQAAATFQRVSGGRLLLNVVTGGDDVEQRRFGDDLDKDARYRRAGEFLTVFRQLWSGDPVTFHGDHLFVEDATIVPASTWPEIYLGGSSAAAVDVAAEHADVYLTWGEPPAQVADKLDTVRRRVKDLGSDRKAAGDPRFGIRLHVISRPTAAEAWAQADRLLAGLSPEQIQRAQQIQRSSGSEGQRRMTELHGGRTDNLEVSPNLWAGVGLVRGGAGTALVGSHEEVADRIEEYYRLGLDEFVLSGYPHLEEAFSFGEGVLPILAERGLLGHPTPTT
ncbi:LLM class flavin-dependent oxidoreductase [Mycolicibacter hiberniae]|uniref:Alkanesulfonate monooxygenase n=1 Tax=Mycolicibacter hiberniae TaxID=29314 RepID=A0A7I7X4D9_9MYCO|nr:LLM class flavin-dependent oxidoreductase [Mycolicibacter hiberniae]MCV7087842.1 LLM class flavin-dependent oxidoreductase [Mycolicibacter hiberniae]ORV66753.1 alkanesulfonate monooxygenase [Mycolicibacter hiberniae]BBZ23581.1 alkanesulfonate monooxygenase [Mycolicibacter hiberniae]